MVTPELSPFDSLPSSKEETHLQLIRRRAWESEQAIDDLIAETTAACHRAEPLGTQGILVELAQAHILLASHGAALGVLRAHIAEFEQDF
ncbi:hypothetical protein ACFQX4_22535 [Roseomonas sp. GCM10028921]